MDAISFDEVHKTYNKNLKLKDGEEEEVFSEEVLYPNFYKIQFLVK